MKRDLIILLSFSSLILLGSGCENTSRPIGIDSPSLVNKSQIRDENPSQPKEETAQNIPEQKSYTTYSGAYFDIEYPSNFTVDERVLDESMTDKYAEVAFISPNKDVEFYVFSPLWGGVAEYETIAETEEVVAEQQNSTGDEFSKTTTKWIIIEALDGSYARSMRIITTNDETVRYLFGIKYNSQAALDLAREDYNHFTNSLKQYADA